MIKIIGLLSFFYMSNIYAMKDGSSVNNTNIDAMRHNFSVNNTKSSRAPRACLPCRAGKERCDGKDPCQKCANQYIRCSYAEMQKRGRKPKYKPSNPELHNATMIPILSLTNQDVSNSYKEEGCFYIGDNDLNQKSKKRKQSDTSENIVCIDITDDAESNDIKSHPYNDEEKPYVFGDALSEVYDPWIRN